MHQALLVDEIVRIITSSVARDKAALCALARTCRSLSEPALDVLWADLDTIIPLFFSLPEGSIYREDRNGFISYKLKYDLTLADWLAIRKYSTRIKRLGNGVVFDKNMKGKDVSYELLLALCRPPAGSHMPLFPRLRVLDWEYPGSYYLFFLQALVSPSLTDVTLLDTELIRFLDNEANSGPPFEDSGASEILESLGECCPGLRHFTWIDEYHIGEAARVLSAAVYCWRNLESLHVGVLTDAVILHLSQLPSLRDLRFHTPILATQSVSPLPLHVPVFVPLRDLSLTQHLVGFEEATKALQAIGGSLPCSSFMAFAHEAVSSSPDLSDLISTVSRCFKRETLAYIYLAEELEDLRFHDPMQADRADLATFSITRRTLQPIFSFSRLDNIEIETQRRIDLGDSDLLDMVTAWPNLRKLRFNHYHGWRVIPSITLTGLATALALLPCIEIVELAIDGSTSFDPVTQGNASGAVASSLRYLNLLDSTAGEELADATYCLLHILASSKECDLEAWRLKGRRDRGNRGKRWWASVFETLKNIRSGITTDHLNRI